MKKCFKLKQRNKKNTCGIHIGTHNLWFSDHEAKQEGLVRSLNHQAFRDGEGQHPRPHRSLQHLHPGFRDNTQCHKTEMGGEKRVSWGVFPTNLLFFSPGVKFWDEGFQDLGQGLAASTIPGTMANGEGIACRNSA